MGPLRARPAALLLVLAVFAAAPVAGEEEVTAETDRLLWCASAFYWLAGSAEDSGDTEEAELYDSWSTHLTDFAGQALTALGYTPERIAALITRYDEATLTQIGAPDAPYDIVACAALAPSD